MISPFLQYHFKRSEDTLLCCDAMIGSGCQHFGNGVNIKVGIYINIITPSKVLCQKDFEKCPSWRTSKDNSGNIANIVICFYVLKFSKENYFTFPFCCTVLCAGCSAKEGLNRLFHRACLRKNRETLQI